MTIELDKYREEFPICDKQIYFDHAAIAPPSKRVRDAVVRRIDDLTDNGILHVAEWEKRVDQARAVAGALVGGSGSDIALVRNTSHGLGLIAEGIQWRSGDEVAVCTRLEFPSNVYPWQHLADHGVRVKAIQPVDGGVTPQAVEDAITADTRLLAISAIQYATGHKTDLKAIGAICKDRGILLCVDGIQQVGAARLDVQELGIDFLAADSHKWMLGLCGIGLLYVSPEVIDHIRPSLVGWRSTTDAFTFDRTHFELRKDAGKFEEGSPAYVLIDGFEAALVLLLEVGLENIEGRIKQLTDRLDAGLTELGCDVGPVAESRGGIVLFRPPGGQLMETARALEEASIRVSLRRGRIRVSPHFYNNEADIDALLEVVAKFKV